MIGLLSLILGLFIGCMFGFIIGIYAVCWLIDNDKSRLYVKRREAK